VEDAIAALGRGEMIVLIDAPERENEGDLVMAADAATATAINFMTIHGRGLVCVPMKQERLDQLGIPPMVAKNTDAKGTAFHVSVDHATETSTGISAADRAATIRALADESALPSDFNRPGHVFPLAGRPGGVLRRAGHTEAALDMVTLAGHASAAVICEIVGEDGEMERLPGLLAFAERHGLEITTIADLIAYRLRAERLVTSTASASMPLNGANFQIIGYRDHTDDREHVALTLGDVANTPGALVRMHSECLTGDVFGSRRCDCGAQLDLALQMIAEEGCGAVVYLRGHEGRGIGILEKIHAYRLQDEGFDTVDANLELGHPVDRRDYGAGMQILRDLGIRRLRLLSNNPAKRAGLEGYGLEVVDRIPLVTERTPENARYLETKQSRLGHLLGPA
jgi:3,4-dihydroxy 2-butanone 4-phosphate synthase/GTP cyclohydrolase II